MGASAANADRVLAELRRADQRGARLAVAPELAVAGYPPRDLLERTGFLDAVEAQTLRIVREAPRGMTVVLGTVLRDRDARGTPLYNAAVAARDGEILATARKQLLPTYDVFDEARYFRPGTETTIVTVPGVDGETVRAALTVCEDGWYHADESLGRYGRDPLEGIDATTADLIVNVSASPFTVPKLRERGAVFSALARRTGVRVLLVNQVGGNDDLLFDGRSTVWSPSGVIEAQAAAFEEDLLVTELGASAGIAQDPETDEEAAYRALVMGVRDYAKKCRFESAVVGLSGGIDSALTATIAADALGRDRVTGIALPSRFSSEGSLRDAEALAHNLGIVFRVVSIDGVFQTYLDELRPRFAEFGDAPPGDVTEENLQARIRAVILMAISNRTGALVLTTGNKSEIAVGYCTLYGDMVGGLAVIGDLPKTFVYRVARWVNRNGERIPDDCITKPPSAELRPDQKDSDSLPPYDVLDPILEAYVESGLSRDQIVERGHDARIVDRVLHLHHSSEYKRRQMAPGLIVTRKAFGIGRRIPIARGGDA